jgi:hypothetical protein
MSKLIYCVTHAVIVLSVLTAIVSAQDDGASASANAPSDAAAQAGEVTDRSQSTVDTKRQTFSEINTVVSTAAVENTRPASSEIRSFYLPFLWGYQSVDSNPLTNTTSGQPMTFSSIGAGLDLRRNSGRSDLALDYAGADERGVTNQLGRRNWMTHQLELIDTIRWRRWALVAGNQDAYSSESLFGSYAAHPSALGARLAELAGGASPELREFLAPDQSILTTRSARLSSAFVAETEYLLSPRSSILAAGGYNLLDFFQSSFLNSSTTTLLAAYNHQMTRSNTIGLAYQQQAFRFPSVGQYIVNSTPELVFTHAVTGRLSVLISGGPQISNLSGVASRRRVLPDLESAIQYRFSESAIALSYQQRVTNGSGVFAGAEMKQLEAHLSQNFGRVWGGSFGAGSAHNRGLAGVQLLAGVQPTVPSEAFNTWYASVEVGRPLGRTADLFVAYNLQRQNSAVPLCAGTLCAKNVVRHQISFGFDWHHQPIALGGGIG